MNPKKREMVYEINFKRLASEPSMEIVLRRPFSDEIEDYREYKRLRQVVRSTQEEALKVKKQVTFPTLKVSSDGTTEDTENEESEAESHDSLTDEASTNVSIAK